MSLEILQTLWRWIDRVVDSKEGLARRCIRRRWLNVFAFYLTQETIRKRPDLPVEVYQLIAAAAITIATKMWEDDDYFSVEDVREHLPRLFTKRAIIDAEWTVLEAVDYDLQEVTRKCFFQDQKDLVLSEIRALRID